MTLAVNLTARVIMTKRELLNPLLFFNENNAIFSAGK